MPKWLPLQKLIPKTLWGQLFSLLLLALLVSQAITLALFIDLRQNDDIKLSEDKITTEIANVINNIDKSQNSGRPTREYLASATNAELTFRGGPTAANGKDDRPEYSQHFANKLRQKLNDQSLEIKIVIADRVSGGTSKLTDLPDNIKISVQLTDKFWLNVDRRAVTESLDWIAPLLLTTSIMIIFIFAIQTAYHTLNGTHQCRARFRPRHRSQNNSRNWIARHQTPHPFIQSNE